MATTVYDTEKIQLQNGVEVELKPLTIKKLRQFMAVIAKTANVETEDETLTLLLEACAIALKDQVPDLVADSEKFEDSIDVPTMNRILEVCGGIKLDDPNLLAAAVLAGQN